MSVKIDVDKKTDDRRHALWLKFGKVVSRKLEFMKKFDARVYNVGLDAIEGIVQTTWIDITKKCPQHNQRCFVETNVCVTWGFYNSARGGFYIHGNTSDFAKNDDEAIQWIPYPNDFKS